MASRKKRDHKPQYSSRDLTQRGSYPESSWFRSNLSHTKTIKVLTYLPRPVALGARRKVYPYPFPSQVRRRARTIRKHLVRRPGLVPVRISIRLPRRVPLARGSYVSLSRGRLQVHSRKQLQALMSRREYNRRRYGEGKYNQRKARHGQLDSPDATRFGAVAESYHRGSSINKIAEAALGARAVGKGGW